MLTSCTALPPQCVCLNRIIKLLGKHGRLSLISGLCFHFFFVFRFASIAICIFSATFIPRQRTNSPTITDNVITWCCLNVACWMSKSILVLSWVRKKGVEKPPHAISLQPTHCILLWLMTSRAHKSAQNTIGFLEQQTSVRWRETSTRIQSLGEIWPYRVSFNREKPSEPFTAFSHSNLPSSHINNTNSLHHIYFSQLSKKIQSFTAC